MAKKPHSEESRLKVTRSYLKWAGSKTKLISQIEPLIPDGAKRLIEPFAGSGVVALNLASQFNKVLLSDGNRDLVSAHRHVINMPEFPAMCRELFHTPGNPREIYKNLREEFNKTCDETRKAALFVYLNRHCFNGLCRYSAKGVFNSPIGQIESPYFPETEMASFSTSLKKAKVICSDFRGVLKKAKAGDFVYCDPPYAPLTETANFSAYAAGGFSMGDQTDLVALAISAVERGATVAISNHDTLFTREIYQKASKIIPLMVSRTISCVGSGRTKAPEIIAVFSPERA